MAHEVRPHDAAAVLHPKPITAKLAIRGVLHGNQQQLGGQRMQGQTARQGREETQRRGQKRQGLGSQ